MHLAKSVKRILGGESPFKKIMPIMMMLPILWSCHSQQAHEETSIALSDSTKQQTKPSQDSLSKAKVKHLELYVHAISTFIKAAEEHQNNKYDTIFFGKHVFQQQDDFPDISLPERIENTQVRLIEPPETSQYFSINKGSIYINLMSWIDPQHSRFLFVLFGPGFRHLQDYTLEFSRASSDSEWEISEILYEDYRVDPKHPSKEVLMKRKKPKGDGV